MAIEAKESTFYAPDEINPVILSAAALTDDQKKLCPETL
jgi:hypothetical protein